MFSTATSTSLGLDFFFKAVNFLNSLAACFFSYFSLHTVHLHEDFLLSCSHFTLLFTSCFTSHFPSFLDFPFFPLLLDFTSQFTSHFASFLLLLFFLFLSYSLTFSLEHSSSLLLYSRFCNLSFSFLFSISLLH